MLVLRKLFHKRQLEFFNNVIKKKKKIIKNIEDFICLIEPPISEPIPKGLHLDDIKAASPPKNLKINVFFYKSLF